MRALNIVRTKQRNRHRLLLVIALALSLAACLVLPLPQTSDRAVDTSRLDALIGASKASVVNEIGSPTYRITGVQADYLVYEGYIDSTGIIFMLWIPIGVDVLEEDRLDCLRLEFKDGALLRYDIESRSTTYHESVRDCRKLFWSAAKVEHVDPLMGASRPAVENVFGLADWVVWDQTTAYLIYQYYYWAHNDCVLLEFRDNDALVRYDIKSCSLSGTKCPGHPRAGVDKGYLDCRQLFWTKDELKTLVR